MNILHQSKVSAQNIDTLQSWLIYMGYLPKNHQMMHPNIKGVI